MRRAWLIRVLLVAAILCWLRLQSVQAQGELERGPDISRSTHDVARPANGHNVERPAVIAMVVLRGLAAAINAGEQVRSLERAALNGSAHSCVCCASNDLTRLVSSNTARLASQGRPDSSGSAGSPSRRGMAFKANPLPIEFEGLVLSIANTAGNCNTRPHCSTARKAPSGLPTCPDACPSTVLADDV